MSKRNQHVVPREDGWAVRGAGAQRDTQVFDRKQDAVDRAREISQNQKSELVVHGQNGQIAVRMENDHRTHIGPGRSRAAETAFRTPCQC